MLRVVPEPTGFTTKNMALRLVRGTFLLCVVESVYASLPTSSTSVQRFIQFVLSCMKTLFCFFSYFNCCTNA